MSFRCGAYMLMLAQEDNTYETELDLTGNFNDLDSETVSIAIENMLRSMYIG